MTKMLYRQKERNYEKQKMQKMQEYYRRKAIRNYYKEVNKAKMVRQVNLIKGMDGQLIGDETGIQERWMEHFKHTLNEDDNLEEEDQEDSEDQIEKCSEPTEDEVNDILNKLKNNKSPGGNGITAVIIRYGGGTVWKKECMPRSWQSITIIPLHKKGDITECNNFRGISLLDVVYKVLATLMKTRMKASWILR